MSSRTYRVGYVPGVFDLLHVGHLNLLRAARARCQTLVVGVVSDQGTAAYKHRRPWHDEQTRLAVITELRMVDFADLQATTDPSPNLVRWRPDALFHGDDWDRLKEGHDTLRVLGIEFVKLPYTKGICTTEIIGRMMERAEAVT